MARWILATLLLLGPTWTWAVMQQEKVVHQDGDVTLQGWLFWDDAFEGTRPGVLVFHERWGLNDYPKLRAEMLAETGFVAFAADLFGQGRMTRDPAEADNWVAGLTADDAAWHRRADLALAQLKAHPKVDAEQVVAIGYGLGAATALRLAYAGAEVAGVVGFHGPLRPPTAEQAAAIKAPVLIAHGDADPAVPAERRAAFTAALAAGGTAWEMDIYGGARGSFTNPYADGYGITGLAYHEAADRRAWLRMLAFFEELFEQPLVY